MNKINYSTNDLRISFLLYATDNTATNTSVHIDDLSITGGGTDLTSDPFDIDDITAY